MNTEIAAEHPNSEENRRRYDNYFDSATRRFIESIPLSGQSVKYTLRRLSGKIYDFDHCDGLSGRFPSGTFLFHSAKTSSMVEILKSGYLINARAIDDSVRDDNGGSEGISWSLSQIEAMPATRYHIAGFVAPPEKVLDKRTQLAVPDHPAPYEVVQLSRNINAEWYYNSYAKARDLECQYKQALSAGLSQEAKELRDQIFGHKALLEEQLSVRNDVRIPVSKLHMVIPYQDARVWIEVLARCPAKPAGIILYDSSNIWREDFVSQERGDGQKLTDYLRSMIPESDQTIGFERLIGRPFGDTMRSGGGKSHIVDGKWLTETRRIILEDGHLAIV